MLAPLVARIRVPLAVIAGFGLTAACAAIGRVANLVAAPASFLVLFSLAFVCYAAGIALLPSGSDARTVLIVVVVGVVARLAVLPALPTLSTDAYRYVWDARVAHAGISPYAYPPSAATLQPLRDTVVSPHLNHPTWRTIYPPGAQAFFQLVYGIRPDSVRAMKLAVAVLELVGLLAVFGLLRAGKRPLSNAIVYAWNPLVIVEICGTGHVDGIIVPVVAGAAWMAIRGTHAAAGALLGVAALVKLYPAALLVLLPLSAWPAAVPAFVAVALIGYAPATLAGASVLGSLPRYLVQEYFNIGLVRTLLPSPAVSVAAAALWVVGVATIGRDRGFAARAVPLIGGLLLLSPNMFPWYAVWLVPFLAWSPSVPWIAFTGSIAFAYAFFLGDPWAIPAWARALEFAPLVAGVLAWAVRRFTAHACSAAAT